MNFCDVALGKNSGYIPFWFMRQAGRYLEEYQNLRKKAGGFLELCFEEKLASDVTLIPVEKFDTDAAILFSDILIIPYALGLNVQFHENTGPHISKFNHRNPLLSLNRQNFSKEIQFLEKIIRNIKKDLSDTKALIGFTGMPWSLATYMYEGSSSLNQNITRRASFEHTEEFSKLINFLTECIIEYLSMQIESGVDAIQLFESHATFLSEDHFERWIVNPAKEIILVLREKYPHVPVISFPRGAGTRIVNYAVQTNPHVISCDTGIDLKTMKELQNLGFCVQGNLDPYALFSSQNTIKEMVEPYFSTLADKPFIFNLGHGILPKTPVENVEYLSNLIKEHNLKRE